MSIATAVTSGAQAAWSIGKALYDLIEDTKTVDAAVKALASEATQLGNTCDAVDKPLKRLADTAFEPEDAQNLLNIHYKLAACTFYLHDASIAESALVTVVEQSPQSTEDALNLCHAGHLLALLYIGSRRLEPARLTCSNAYKTRRKPLAKNHEQCYEDDDPRTPS